VAKILILSPAFPLPLQSGGQVRLFHVIRHLSRNHEVSLLSFSLPENERLRPELAPYCRRIETVPGRRVTSLVGRALLHMQPREMHRSAMKGLQLLQGVPLHYCRFAHPQMRRTLLRMLREDPCHVVQAEYSQMAPYLLDPAVKRLSEARVLVEIDLPFRAMLRTRESLRGWGRHVYGWETGRALAYEKKILPEFLRVVMMSAEDEQELLRLCPSARTLIAPNGVDTERFPPRKEQPRNRKLLFVGGDGHLPNVVAVDFFASRILPLLLREEPGTTLTVVGDFRNTLRRKTYAPAFRFEGFVESLQPYLESHAVFVAPLRIGGGTRLKILEAMSAQIPVVSTEVGAEGIRLRAGEDFLVADSPEGFSRAVVSLLRDPDRAFQIARNGRRAAEALYSWDTVLTPLSRLYTERFG